MKISLNQMVKMGMLAALAIVLMIPLRFPLFANFLTYDPADVPILVGTFMFGPAAGLVITVIVALIQAVLLNPDGGWVGLVMHIIATGTLVIVAGTIYKRFHTIKGAIVALIAGALSMTFIMIPSNIFFDVKFYGYPYDAVKALILPAILPFNLVKSFANSLIVLLIYKPLSRALKGFGSISKARNV